MRPEKENCEGVVHTLLSGGPYLRRVRVGVLLATLGVLAAVLAQVGRTAEAGPVPGSYVKTVAVGAKKVKATVVELPSDAFKADVVLGGARVGSVEWLESMARRSGAIAAVNGTFFDAYTKGERKEPWGNIIRQGRVVHIGGAANGPGTTIGFTADGKVKIERLKIRIQGAVNGQWGWPGNWYAYRVNHTPGASAATLFTPEWGPRLGFARGFSAVVSKGTVVETAWNLDVEIPPDGFVIHLVGSETYLANRFRVGDKIEYKTVFTDAFDREVDWGDVVTAVGAGPLLLKDGRIVADPAAEGFAHPKILSMAMARSAVGVKPDGTLLLANLGGATVKEAAQVMKALGARYAVNLDGGASSGLWFAGRYLVKPGRAVSNALVFLRP